jgi:ribosome-associated toxin RatA of RatAB toxin-antitoxin module
MAEQSTQSITIAAAPDRIMAVIADFDRYPEWAGSVKKAEVREAGPDGRAKRVAFSLDAGMVRDEYELEYVWTGVSRVEWVLVHGMMMRAQRGSYTLQEQESGLTEVTYSLSVELVIPMLGLLRRKAERVVMDTALKELKKYVEASPA